MSSSRKASLWIFFGIVLSGVAALVACSPSATQAPSGGQTGGQQPPNKVAAHEPATAGDQRCHDVALRSALLSMKRVLNPMRK